MMSSMVMTPRILPSSATTGMTLRSYFAMRRATSSWSIVGGTERKLVRMTSEMPCSAWARRSSRRLTVPVSFPWSTTYTT